MTQKRKKTIKQAFEVAKDQCQGDTEAFTSKLLGALDGTLGDAQSFCWGVLRQLERYEEMPTHPTPRDFGLHHVDQHLLLAVASVAISHLELVEHLLREIGNTSHLDTVLHLGALSEACPKATRHRLREARNLLAAHRDERVLYRRLTGEHTDRSKEAYRKLGIEVPEGSMDTEIIGYSPPTDASPEESAEGVSRVGQLGGGIAHLGEIKQCMEKLDEGLKSLREELLPTEAVPTGQKA